MILLLDLVPGYGFIQHRDMGLVTLSGDSHCVKMSYDEQSMSDRQGACMNLVVHFAHELVVVTQLPHVAHLIILIFLIVIVAVRVAVAVTIAGALCPGSGHRFVLVVSSSVGVCLRRVLVYVCLHLLRVRLGIAHKQCRCLAV